MTITQNLNPQILGQAEKAHEAAGDRARSHEAAAPWQASSVSARADRA